MIHRRLSGYKKGHAYLNEHVEIFSTSPRLQEFRPLYLIMVVCVLHSWSIIMVERIRF